MHRRHRPGVRCGRSPRADPSAGDARRHRPHAARHRHRGGDRDARRAADRRDRTQLLDRSDAHARCGALPRRELALLRQRRAQRRTAADGAEGRDDLSGNGRRDGAGARRVRRRLRRQRDRRMLRHDARAHRRIPRRRRRARARGDARTHTATEAAAIRGVGDDRGGARARRQPADDRRAYQRAGFAQDQAAVARGELRRDHARRPRAGRGRRALARRLHGADRTRRRRRADGDGREAARNRSKRR